jgi:hypothetical protein
LEILQDRVLHMNPKGLDTHRLLLSSYNPLGDPKVSLDCAA